MAAFTWYMYIFALSVITVVLAEPFKRLGQHSAPSKGATTLGGKFPPPAVFYNFFVHLSKPLLMKNVLAELQYPAFMKWTDDYLREHYGLEIVDVERGRKEDRSGGTLELNLSKFLEVYAESNLYMVHNVPDSMQEEVLVPHTLQCGGFQDNLQDSVLWFSGGNTKSVLHRDDLDNINCLLDGEKQLVMIDKIYKPLVEQYGWVEQGSYSMVDVDNVNPEKFPGIQQAPWTKIVMEKGDCVFIPFRWYHHVYSPPGRNLAVNLWFSHLWWFNNTDCNDVGNQSKPLSEFSPAPKSEVMRSKFLEKFAEYKDITLQSFNLECTCKKKEDCSKLWDVINLDKDRVVTWAELYSFNIDDAVTQFPLCFYSDQALKAMYKAMKEEEKLEDVTRTKLTNAEGLNDQESRSGDGVDDINIPKRVKTGLDNDGKGEDAHDIGTKAESGRSGSLEDLKIKKPDESSLEFQNDVLGKVITASTTSDNNDDDDRDTKTTADKVNKRAVNKETLETHADHDEF